MASRIAALALFALLIACGTFAQSQEARDHKAITQKQDSTKQKKQTAKQKSAPIEKVKTEPIKDASDSAAKDSDEKLKIDRELAEYTGKLAVYTEQLAVYTKDVSRFTFWLVCATVILGIVGAAQGYLTWRSVRTGESALADLERPYLFLDFGEGPVFPAVTTVDLPRMAMPIKYSFYNGGRTPAIITHHRDKIARAAPGQQLPPPIDFTKDPSDEMPNGFAIDKRRSMSIDFANDASGLDGIFLMGFIRYEDIFSKGHIRGYCAMFHKKTNRFVMIGDERYNYTKDE